MLVKDQCQRSSVHVLTHKLPVSYRMLMISRPIRALGAYVLQKNHVIITI